MYNRSGVRPSDYRHSAAITDAQNDLHKEHPLGETIGSRVMGWLTLKY